MDNLKDFAGLITLGIGAALGCIYGEDNTGIMIVLCAFIIIDFITGIVYSYFMHELSSKKCFKGIFKKMYELILCGVCHMLDVYVLGGGSVLLSASCFLFITAEALSLLENAAKLGVPIPKKLVSSLIQIKQELTGGALNEDEIKTGIEEEYERQEKEKKEKEEKKENEDVDNKDKV